MEQPRNEWSENLAALSAIRNLIELGKLPNGDSINSEIKESLLDSIEWAITVGLHADSVPYDPRYALSTVIASIAHAGFFGPEKCVWDAQRRMNTPITNSSG